jgi:hypothetical protein
MIVISNPLWIGLKKTVIHHLLQVESLDIGTKMKLGRKECISSQTNADALMTNGKIGIKMNIRSNGM